MKKKGGRRASGGPQRELHTEPVLLAKPVRLIKPVHGGACLARDDQNRTLFVRGGLPSELVRVAVTSEHKRYAWADVVEVVEPSAHRVPHVWKEAADGGIGGVELGHVEPAFQREWKSTVLDEQLRRLGGPQVVADLEALVGVREGEDCVLVPVNPAPGDEEDRQLLHRRTRVQLVAGEDGALGMRPYRSHDVVPVTALPIAAEKLDGLRALEAGVWDGTWVPGERVALEAPNASPPVLVTARGVFTAPGEQRQEFSRWSVTADGQTHQFRVRPGAFWQTHRSAPATLVEAVLEAAQPREGQTVLELYSGSGLFSRFLVDRLGANGRLWCLEGNGEAARAAREVLAVPPEREEGASEANRGVVEGMVNRASVLALAQKAGGEVDTVVLDPPRSGAGRQVAEAVAETGAHRVVLVSCDPAAGARDLADFVSLGFRIAGAKAWDLFPHTHHFECVFTLVRKD